MQTITVRWLPATYSKPGRWSVSAGWKADIYSATNFSLAVNVAQAFALKHDMTGKYAEGVIEVNGIVTGWVYVRFDDLEAAFEVQP